MKLKRPHAPYVANKIAIDVANSTFVSIATNMDDVKDISLKMILADIANEESLEERVREIIEDNEDEIEFMRLNEKELFWMIKKKMSEEFGVILNLEDRYNNLSHTIMTELLLEDIIKSDASETRIKNVIFKAIFSYIKSFEDIEDSVLERIDNYKRKLIPGTEEYDIVFQKLYEEELKKRSLL
eukprot:TRINITY_DN3744_c0_g5_i1.p6 TRINITY_DN3744_c0_g5~~TRINITY_DN3744_c0_g5_i1.p6  ORF type:complete len:184 (-),score=31.08 TRINITY_DN3744_c0_g5_i1:1712-2263(-)